MAREALWHSVYGAAKESDTTEYTHWIFISPLTLPYFTSFHFVPGLIISLKLNEYSMYAG